MSLSKTKQARRLRVRRDLLGRILPLACVLALLHGLRTSAQPNDWITFTDETSRIVIVDSPGPDDFVGSTDTAEKDMAVGDLDGDGNVDLVIVRKVPFYSVDGLRNVLFMNQDDGFGNRELVDRTADFAPAMMDATPDRDVVIVDVNGDNLLDVVTAAINNSHPRVYINLGSSGGTWLGLNYDANDGRVPTWANPGPNFCGVAAGDVDNDGDQDLYFVDYNNTLEDRLLINNINNDPTKKGFFTDETVARMTLALHGQPCIQDPADPCVAAGGKCVNLVCDGRLYMSDFGTGAVIADLNDDFFMDIVKSEVGAVHIVYNDGWGGFDMKQLLGGFQGVEYMAAVTSLDNTPLPDVYIVKDYVDVIMLNDGVTNGQVDFTISSVQSPRVWMNVGNVRFADLDGDQRDDVLASDVDISSESCQQQLAILRNHTALAAGTAMCDPFRMTIDPAWLPHGTFDTAVLPNFENFRPALYCGTCSGGRLFKRVQADNGGLPFVDCNNNSITDSCDINVDPSLDCDGNGIIDSCTNGTQSCGCVDNNECTFDVCVEMNPQQCTHETTLYGDVVGPGGACGPDGAVTQADVDAVVAAMAHACTGCTIESSDIAGDNGSCGPDGVVGLMDFLAVGDAFDGNPACCPGGSGPPTCPPDTENPIIIFDPTPIYPAQAQPGDPVIAYDVDVHVYGFNLLRGYQVDLEITGPQASYAVISNITVDHTKPTYVFAATPSGGYDEAIDMTGLRMIGALRTGGVNVRSYLTTFRLDRAPGAPQTFSVTVQTKPQTAVSDPNGCEEFPPNEIQIFPFE